jgi:PAS domain S-box-containing protein
MLPHKPDALSFLADKQKISHVQEAILMAEEPGRIVFANSNIEQLIGYTANELIGQSFSMIFPERVRHGHEAVLNNIIVSGDPIESYEVKLNHKNGQELDAEMALSVTVQQGRTILTAQIRKKTGTSSPSLPVENNLLRHFLNTLNDAYLCCNVNGEIIYSAGAVEQILGMKTEELQGRELRNIIPESECDRFNTCFNLALESFQASHSTTLKLKGGTTEIEIINKLNDNIINALTIRMRMAESQALAKKESHDEEKFFNFSGEIFCILNGEKIENANAAFAEITGYGQAEWESIKFESLISADERAEVIHAINDLRHTASFESRIINKYGVQRQLHLTVIKGENSRKYIIGRDETHSRHTEKELRTKSNHYRMMFTSNPVPMFIYDTSGLKVLAANNAALVFFGYSGEEIRKLKMPDLVPAGMRPGLTNMLGKARLNARMHFTEWEYQRKNGEAVPVELYSQAVPYMHFNARLISIFELLKNNRKEHSEIEKAESSLMTLLENTEECIWSIGSNQEILVANTAFRQVFESIFGFPADEIQYRVSEIPEKLVAKYKKIISKVKDGHPQHLEKTFTINGRQKSFELHFYPVVREGHVIAISCHAHDITGKKKLEDVLQQLSSDISTATGEQFFQSLARNLSEQFEAEFVVAGRTEPGSLNTLSVYHKGQPGENVDYQLEGTPIGLVVESGQQIIRKGVQKQFPEDKFLKGMDIESFIGVPLLNQENKCMGVIAMMFSSELKSERLIEYVLQIFASRAGAELERLQAEEEVYQSEANLKALIDNAQEAIWAVDKEYRITVVNEAFKRLFSFYYGVELEKGMRMIDHFPEKAKEAWMNRFQRALKGEQFIMDRHFDFGEDYMDTEVSINPIIRENGSVTGVSYFSRDITHRKRSEEAIRKSEYRYRTLIETMHVGLVYVDNEGIIQFVNRQLCEMSGYTEQELLGMNSDIFAASPEMASRLREQFGMRQSGSATQYEVLFVKKNNETFWGLVNGIPLKGDNGKFAGSMATITDISELKSTEENLKKMNLELNTFIYKSSHDIKGPLSSILGLTELAQKEVRDAVSLSYLEMIRQSAARLDKILLDLLDTIRIKEGNVKPEEIDFDEMLQDILLSLNHSPGYNRLSYSQEIDYTVPFFTDKNILRSVLQNLIDNAIKYQDYGKEEIRINIRIHDNPKGVLISVSDNGLGISQVAQNQIFDMFYRAHLETKGTGLGLYIVKNAVSRLGGHIWVESEEGKGSVFNLIIANLNHQRKEDD